MKKSTMKSAKTTESKRPETTIIATIEVVMRIDDQMTHKDEAKEIIHDIIDGIDVDKYEIKNVKYFERNMEG